MSVPVEV